MYVLFTALPITLGSVPATEQADNWTLLDILQVKLSFLRIPYNAFSDLVPTSASGPNSCPPLTCTQPVAPLKHLQSLNSLGPLAFAHAVPLSLEHPPTFVCLSESFPSLKTYLKRPLPWEASAAIPRRTLCSSSVFPQHHPTSVHLYSLTYWEVLTVFLLEARTFSVLRDPE